MILKCHGLGMCCELKVWDTNIEFLTPCNPPQRNGSCYGWCSHGRVSGNHDEVSGNHDEVGGCHDEIVTGFKSEKS